jgi:uncharacterized membrane protein YedE/YeeE
VKAKFVGLLAGAVFGFTLAWAQLNDPRVIRDMLLLQEAHVFLIMGSAVVIAAVGVRLLTMVGARTIVTREPIGWTVERPQIRHVSGSILFAVGWTAAGTCPGPAAAMLGQGAWVGLPVAAGLFAGVLFERLFPRTTKVEQPAHASAPAGL